MEGICFEDLIIFKTFGLSSDSHRTTRIAAKHLHKIRAILICNGMSQCGTSGTNFIMVVDRTLEYVFHQSF